MIDRLVFVALMLLYGTLLGGTLCNLTCGPLLVLRLAGQGRGAKQGLLFATIFSAPRIVLLTVLGVVVGYLGGEWGEVNEVTIGILLKPLLYLFISAIMILSGIRFLLSRKRECGEKRGGLKRRITRAAFRIGPASGSSERIKLFGIGILVSLMCLSQGAIASMAVSSALIPLCQT